MTAVLPLYCGSHSDVVRILQRADIGGHLVGPPTDSGGVDGVRHGVAPLLVVPGVGEARPHVLDVGDVGVVQRPEQVATHQAADLGVVGVVDVEVDSTAQLGDRLVAVVEGRDLDLDAVLILEALDGLRAEVVGVVVDLERRALLRRESVGDGFVVVGDVPLDRVSGAASVRVGCPDDGPDFEHAVRKAPRVGAVAARIAARARNCRRVGPCCGPLGTGIWGLPVDFAACRW